MNPIWMNYKESLKVLKYKREKLFKFNLKQFRKFLASFVLLSFIFSQTAFAVDLAGTGRSLVGQTPTLSLEEANHKQNQNENSDSQLKENDFLSQGPLTLSTPVNGARDSKKLYYISTTGSDEGDGSVANPWKTLQRAVNQLQAGDTLVVGAGKYVGQTVDLKRSGEANAKITIDFGRAEFDCEPNNDYDPFVDTKGFDHIVLKNLNVKNARNAVEVNDSEDITIDGVRSDKNHFAVKVHGSKNIVVQNAVVTNSRNGFRTELGTKGDVPANILFENIDVSGSKDIYAGYEPKYRNGDGFILEAGNNITVRNVKSYNNWDGGMDIKANNVLVENIEVYGNKNNFKTWGTAIVIKNAYAHDAVYMDNDPVSGEGNGVNARMGQVTFINSTFVNNESFDIKVDNDGGPAKVTFINSIVYRTLSSGKLFTNIGGIFTDKTNLFYWAGKTNAGFTLNSSSVWADPQFVSANDVHLKNTSVAINHGDNSANIAATDLDKKARMQNGQVDLGVYEFSGVVIPVDDSTVANPPTPNPPTPNPPTTTCTTEMCGVANGATVSGTVKFGPNLVRNPDVKKVAYYLNSNSHSKEYSSPFYFGGVDGFDTRTLADGEYNLAGAYTTKTGDHHFSINFIVKNGNAAPPATTPQAPATGACKAAICGANEGETLKGVVTFRPNEDLRKKMRKIFYYVDGSQAAKVYDSPFAWSIDTKTLSNGKHTVHGTYNVDGVEFSFSITFTVAN